jgi:hypothetical protein
MSSFKFEQLKALIPFRGKLQNIMLTEKQLTVQTSSSDSMVVPADLGLHSVAWVESVGLGLS